MLGWRLLVSAILIPALIGLFYLDTRVGITSDVLFSLCLLLAVRGAWEMTNLLRTRSFDPDFPLCAVLCCAVIYAGWVRIVPDAGQMGRVTLATKWDHLALTYSSGVLLLLLNRAIRYREPGKSMETLGAELLIVSYVGLLLAITAQLRWVNSEVGGYLVLGSLVVAAKCGDIGAYTLGRLFGKKKMVPLLSPGKTWMGAWGAVLGAALGSWVWLTLAPSLISGRWHARPAVWSVLFGAIIGVVGLIGDLCESLIKRDVGRKDSAALLPGFGGLLDLLDSVLYAGPVAYILWRILPL